jgi:hypothetical protein
MALGRIALKPIDQPGLGRAEEEPIVTGLLQRDEELLTAVYRLVVDIVPALEFGLKRELAAQWMVSAALAPDAYVRVGGDPLAEVQHPQANSTMAPASMPKTISMGPVMAAGPSLIQSRIPGTIPSTGRVREGSARQEFGRCPLSGLLWVAPTTQRTDKRLKAGVLEDGTTSRSTEGTPQGGVCAVAVQRRSPKKRSMNRNRLMKSR